MKRERGWYNKVREKTYELEFQKRLFLATKKRPSPYSSLQPLYFNFLEVLCHSYSRLLLLELLNFAQESWKHYTHISLRNRYDDYGYFHRCGNKRLYNLPRIINYWEVNWKDTYRFIKLFWVFNHKLYLDFKVCMW